MIPKQETFNRVAAHLIAQNEKCVDEYGNCRLRIGKLRCSIGCLISDEEFERADRESSPSDPFLGFYNVTHRDGHHEELIDGLRDLHDDYPTRCWRAELQGLAFRHDLDPSMVDRIAGSVAMARAMTGRV
jgi:hypothetical protein